MPLCLSLLDSHNMPPPLPTPHPTVVQEEARRHRQKVGECVVKSIQHVSCARACFSPVVKKVRRVPGQISGQSPRSGAHPLHFVIRSRRLCHASSQQPAAKPAVDKVRFSPLPLPPRAALSLEPRAPPSPPVPPFIDRV